jgi:hypothetical protein
MSPYGQAAIAAVEACRKTRDPDPVTAWNAAIPLFSKTREGQKKSCPRNIFLDRVRMRTPCIERARTKIGWPLTLNSRLRAGLGQ